MGKEVRGRDETRIRWLVRLIFKPKASHRIASCLTTLSGQAPALGIEWQDMAERQPS
jgi:hypothetical protein